MSLSTTSPATTPIYLLANIHNLIPFKLDTSNFVLWRHQISSILRTHSLYGYIDGSLPCPDRLLRSADTSATATETVNPAFSAWQTQDQAVLTILNSTLTPESLTLVIGCSSSRDAWLTLERRYASLTRSNILALKTDLQTLKKRSDSIDSYMHKLKTIRDKLAVSSVTVDDEDMLLYALNGLPPEYNPFRSSLRTRSEPLPFEEYIR